MQKIDYKKDFKNFYLPSKNPVVLEIPFIKFAIIDDQGNPNCEKFAEATAALYSFSYTVKMSYKMKNIPEGYYDYTVFPLEGVWDLVDKTKSITDKSNFAYSIMIRQPEFLTSELFEQFVNETKRKKPNIFLDKIRYEPVFEGMCCQMLHIGSYDEESVSFDVMKDFCEENGYVRKCKKHREIYLSDPRKTEVNKLKTVLRFKVRNK